MVTTAFDNPVFSEFISCLTIGVFDGLHRGHIGVIRKCIETARENNCKSIVASFSTNPKMRTGTEKKTKNLISSADFTEILTQLGVDYHCVIDFSENFSKISGNDFIKMVCNRYNVGFLVEGESFRCGEISAQADINDIKKLFSSIPENPCVIVSEPLFADCKEVSSTAIRILLNNGKTGDIPALLGRIYSVDVRNVIPCISGNRFCYKEDDLEQMLPCYGSYRVIAADKAASVLNPDPSGIDTKAVISSFGLDLELPDNFNPDRIYFL